MQHILASCMALLGCLNQLLTAEVYFSYIQALMYFDITFDYVAFDLVYLLVIRIFRSFWNHSLLIDPC